MLKNITGLMISIVGARRSGKSTLTCKIIRNFFLKVKGVREQDIFILCPTINVSDDYDFLVRARKYKEPDPNIIHEIIMAQEQLNEMYGMERVPEILVIFDDCVDADINIIRYGGCIDAIASRGRHYKINCMVLSQRLNGISLTARSNSDYFLMFSPFNIGESERFMEQFVPKQKRKEFMGKVINVWETPYSFIVIDNTEKSQKKKIKEGFDKIINIYE